MARAPALQDIEAVPESDRLEGFAHPRETKQCFGHESAERELAGALNRGQVHHAWLLTGPPGIGKATLAYRFAKCLLAAPQERRVDSGSLEVAASSQASRQVQVLSHPGLLVLRRPYDLKAKRFTASIPVDEVRRLRSFLGHRAAEGNWRVVIVDSADDLNINAANALLKSLEEPPRRMVFLLVSAEPGRLLNTIRSRCRRLDIGALQRKELMAAVEQAYAGSDEDPPADDIAGRLAQLAQGSVRRFIALHSAGGIEIHEKIGKVFSRLPAVDWGSAHDLAESLGGAAASERYTLYQELLFDELARIIKAAATGLGGEVAVELGGRLIRPDRLASWAALWETLVREEAETRALNLDRKAFILGTLQRIEAAARH
ncbi:MAG: DNA polymerase III subunit delta' [Alphaproteobacteria bacterium]|nr:DNA polymerase III subunit delta' [Alphaproteobacteria bacterium]